MPILTPTAELRRILVARTDGLGDVILTLPLAAAIKKALPNVEVAFLVRPYTAPLVERIAEVDKVLSLADRKGARPLIKGYHPDAIIFAKPDFRLALDALMARVDVRIGTGYRWYSGLFTRWVYDRRKHGRGHEAEYGVKLLGPLLPEKHAVVMPELPHSQEGCAEARRKRAEIGISDPYVVLHPGSKGSAADYPAEKFVEVIRELIRRSPSTSVVVTAGPGERSLAESIVGGAGVSGNVALADGLSLDGLSELLREASGFIGVSSGPAHLAALVRTPVVGLYPGLPPVWPNRWRPLGGVVETLTPDEDDDTATGSSPGVQPENVVARIHPSRIVETALRIFT